MTTNIEREYHKNESNSNTLEKPKIDKIITNKNNRILLVLPSFSGRTYLMLKIFSRLTPDRDIFIITKSPLENISNSKIKIKEIGEETIP